MKNVFITCLLLVGFSLGGFAQEKSNKEIKGDKYYFIYDFENAISKYSHTKDLSAQGQRNLAVSYFSIGKKGKAEEVYSKLISTENGVITEDYYSYAMVLKSNEKNAESNKWMDKFVANNPNDLRGKSYVSNKSRYESYLIPDVDYKVIEQSVNTSSQDFGTSYYQDKVVYASSNAIPKPIKRKYNWNGEPYLNLYIADVKDGQLENPKFFDRDLNGKMHDGPASFSNNGMVMAISRNAVKDKTDDKLVEIQIHLSTFSDGKWSEPVQFIHNNPGYNVGHPNLSEDGNLLYFVSDQPGGFGGSDIYKSTKTTNGSWSTPENLGNVINTEGDELFPFFDEKQQLLTFASDGHFGMGGLDIFTSSLINSSWSSVENPGNPINTKSDDYALISNGDATKGYLSSNRANGSGSDDIYAFESNKSTLIVKTLVGIAKTIDGKPIAGALITLLGDDDEILGSLLANDNGGYSFPIETDKKYEVVGNKDSYIEGHTHTNSFGDDLTITADVTLLEKKIEEVVEVEVLETDLVPETDLAEIIKLNPIYFDFDQSDILPDAAKELDKIVKVLNKYPKVKVELASHTDCRGTTTYNQSLSERRVKSTIEYIQSRITSPERVKGKGFGESKLFNECGCEGETTSDCSETEHQKNRRTEFIVKD